MRWHIHHDPNWQIRGVHIYEQCHCGARRTTRAYRNLEGPSRSDWPSRRDNHGVTRNTSGWQYPPSDGWPPPQLKPPPPAATTRKRED